MDEVDVPATMCKQHPCGDKTFLALFECPAALGERNAIELNIGFRFRCGKTMRSIVIKHAAMPCELRPRTLSHCQVASMPSPKRSLLAQTVVKFSPFRDCSMYFVSFLFSAFSTVTWASSSCCPSHMPLRSKGGGRLRTPGRPAWMQIEACWSRGSNA